MYYNQILTLQRTSTGVDIFFSLIRSYFCFFVIAFKPCHGSEPLEYNTGVTYMRQSFRQVSSLHKLNSKYLSIIH